MVVALYTALRTRVSNEEMKTVGGKNVMKAFSKRVERAGEEERRKGVRRVDFLLGYTRFAGIEPSTDELGVWKICLTPLSVALLRFACLTLSNGLYSSVLRDSLEVHYQCTQHPRVSL